MAEKTCRRCPTTLHRSTKGVHCYPCSQAVKREAYAAKRRAAATPNGVSLPEGRVESGDTCEITKTRRTDIRSIDELIEACEIDTTTWEVERYTTNKYSVVSKPPEGSPPGTPPNVTDLFQVKAWLKRKRALITVREEIAQLIADAHRVIPARPLQAEGVPGGALVEIAVPDLHMGKMAWGKETGHADYDLTIAEELFHKAVDTLFIRTANIPIAKYLFVVGNDLINIDNRQRQTTAGTPQDHDSRYQKTFGATLRMITEVIERLAQVAPVHVPIVPGNHDTLSAWHLGQALELYFAKTPGVTIDNRPTMRKYVEFGKVMLLLTHGDKGKHADYGALMSSEMPEMWGRTLFREAHTGHLHQTRVLEKFGVRVRISPALCPPDAWHSENHYVGNLRGAEAFVWHPEQGLIATAHHTIH